MTDNKIDQIISNINSESPITSKQEELISFCNLLTIASKSAKPFIQALDLLKLSGKDTLAIKWAEELALKLKRGYSVDEAVEEIKSIDPVLAKLMPLIGNERLVKLFEIYTKYLIKQDTCFKQISCLVWYPLIVMILGFLVIVYLNFYSFPLMESMVDFEGYLSTWSLKLLYFSNLYYWPFSLVIPSLLLFLIVDCSIFMITGKFFNYSLWSKISGLSKATKMNERARLAALLYLYLDVGYSFNEAVESSIFFLNDKEKNELLELNKAYIKGNKLAEVLHKSELLSKIINGNETSEELPVKLKYAYNDYNYETLLIIKSVSERLFYIPLILAGFIVLVVSIGLFGSYSLFAWSVV